MPVPALKLVRYEINPIDRISKQVPDPTDYTNPLAGDLVINDSLPATISGVSVPTVKLAVIGGTTRAFKGVLWSDAIAANTSVPPQGIGSGNTVMGGQPCTMQQTPSVNATLGVTSQYGHATPASTVDMVRPAGGDSWRMFPSGWTGQASNEGGPTFYASDFGATLAAVMALIGTAYGILPTPSTYLTADATIAAGASGVTLTVHTGTYFMNGQTITLTGVTTAGVAVVSTLKVLSGGGTGTLVCTWLNATGDSAVGTLFDYDYSSHICTIALTLPTSLWALYSDTSTPVLYVAGVNPDGTLIVQLDATYQTV